VRRPPNDFEGSIQPGEEVDTDQQGKGSLSEPRLYQLVRQSGRVADRSFEITFLEPGAQAYVFTFG